MKKLARTGMNSLLAQEVLAHLGVEAPRDAGITVLDDLVAAYTGRVPWESVSRIAKKASTIDQNSEVVGQDIARWPDEFWRSAIDRGTGGTCFESNYAFLALLETLGYAGYLTVNNMGSSIGCHSAILLTIGGNRWLVDVGLPLYVPLPLDPAGPTQRESPFHMYRLLPEGSGQYTVERSHHPQSYCFTLIDTVVPEQGYRRVLAADYGPDGFFLDRVIVSKVVDGRICRFNGGESPYVLEWFLRGDVERRELGKNPASEIAVAFDLDEQLVQQALRAVGPAHKLSGPRRDGTGGHAEEE